MRSTKTEGVARRRPLATLLATAALSLPVLAACATGKGELEPRYVDATIRRMAEHAGLEARHAETGQSFAEVAKQRAIERSADLCSAPNAQASEAR